jgi:hypothetical protein
MALETSGVISQRGGFGECWAVVSRGFLCCISTTNIEKWYSLYKPNHYPSEPHNFQFVAFCDTFEFSISFSSSYHTTPTPILSKGCSHRIRQRRRERRGSQLPFILIKPRSPASDWVHIRRPSWPWSHYSGFKGDHHRYRYIREFCPISLVVWERT